MEPVKPCSRSSAAQAAEATPPPMRRTSARRSATPGAVGRELRGDGRLEARVEDDHDLVAGLHHGLPRRHPAARVLGEDGDDERALGEADVHDGLVCRRRAVAHLDLDDLELLALEVEQVHEAVLRYLVLDQPQDEVGGRYRGLDAEELEVLEVPRVVDAGDDARDEVLLLRHLADEDVVLVVARDGDDEVGALDPRALEHPELGRVAVLDRVLELLLDGQVALARALDEGDLVLLGDELAGEVPADLAGAGDDHVHAVTPPCRTPPRRPARWRSGWARRCRGRRSTTRRAPGRGHGRRPSGPRSAAGRSARSRGWCGRRWWRR